MSGGLNPFLSVGALDFGFARALAWLRHRLPAGVLLPLVAVVHPSAAQRTRQLALRRRVVFNQRRYGAKFTLAILQEKDERRKTEESVKSQILLNRTPFAG